jgi:hypothetical protein
MELFQASRQWATRPADQRFASLEDMLAATKGYANQAAEASRSWRDLSVQPDASGTEVQLVGPNGTPATLTHYAFGQLCARAESPAWYLRELPAELAAQNLRTRLAERNAEDKAQLLFHVNGSMVVRAVTSDAYARIWNHEVISRLLELAQLHRLVPARQTFSWGGGELPPESERPPALYASDHDMFAFMMSQERTLIDPVGKALLRGVIVQNSEVGDCALKIMGFYFRDICCNHIIWGARELCEVRLTHVGQIRQRWFDAAVTVRKYFDAPVSSEDQARFAEMAVPIRGTKEEVLDAVFGKRIANLTKRTLAAAYDAVVESEDGDPRSRWGLAQGITRHSQTRPYGDERNELDRAAGKLLQVAF